MPQKNYQGIFIVFPTSKRDKRERERENKRVYGKGIGQEKHFSRWYVSLLSSKQFYASAWATNNGA